jgi:hypothetical protein
LSGKVSRKAPAERSAIASRLTHFFEPTMIAAALRPGNGPGSTNLLSLLLPLELSNCRTRYSELAAYLLEGQLAGLQQVTNLATVHVPAASQMGERETVGQLVAGGAFHWGHESCLPGWHQFGTEVAVGGPQRLYQTDRLGGKATRFLGPKRPGNPSSGAGVRDRML